RELRAGRYAPPGARTPMSSEETPERIILPEPRARAVQAPQLSAGCGLDAGGAGHIVPAQFAQRCLSTG
ncbi:hypothetical protein, partial [uncultured Enorma sp.]|uniref:hypothetical protein n=1 Tax=uncultured Enorma sp. TaxID=1714346 RepID=UPI0028061614